MEDELGEIHEVTSDTRICEGCKSEHSCKRCVKCTHICTYCGKMFHECDICGATCKSLGEVKRHQASSNICKKARTLTPISIHEVMRKFQMLREAAKHQRRKSCPQIIPMHELLK